MQSLQLMEYSAAYRISPVIMTCTSQILNPLFRTKVSLFPPGYFEKDPARQIEGAPEACPSPSAGPDLSNNLFVVGGLSDFIISKRHLLSASHPNLP